MWYWVGEPFLYACYALLAGSLVLLAVPVNYRPEITVSNRMLILCAAGISILSFLPVLRIVMFFADDLGFGLTLQSVLSTFEEGKSYQWTLVLSLILMVMLRFGDPERERAVTLLGMCLLIGMMYAVGWASHVSSLYGWLGFMTHSLHFMAVMIWAGTLLAAGWFSGSPVNWRRFLKWFHPLAFVSFFVLISTGIVLTSLVAPEYLNSWMLPYGQALLIKHLLIVPLAIFAFINGFWMKHKLKTDPQFDPRRWARAESILILLIFWITGFMNQQPAPHDVSETLNEAPPSRLYLWFHGSKLDADQNLHLTFHPLSVGMFLLALGAIAGMLVMFRKRVHAGAAIIAGLLFVVTAYVAAMTAVS